MARPGGSGDVLSRRALNRALLARQLLLRRADCRAEDAVARLVGLHAQSPTSPYLALWSRLAPFEPADVGSALEQRRLVRIIAMRGTIHLLTPSDAAGLRGLTQPVMDAALRTVKQYVPGRGGASPADIASAAREYLATNGPTTTAALGAALVPHFAGSDAAALGFAARAALPLVQVPPRGVWGRSGQPVCDTLESWTGLSPGGMDVDQLVLRFLGAFGPASVADAQAWSGLTGLGEVMDRLSPGLRRFRGPAGTALYDLPHAPRPDPSVTAPVRLLPDFDNVLLSHADRTRVVAPGYRPHFVSPNGQVPGTVLVDGFARAQWRVVRSRGTARVEVTPFDRLPVRAAGTVEREAGRLLRTTDPDLTHDVHLLTPA